MQDGLLDAGPIHDDAHTELKAKHGPATHPSAAHLYLLSGGAPPRMLWSSFDFLGLQVWLHLISGPELPDQQARLVCGHAGHGLPLPGHQHGGRQKGGAGRAEWIILRRATPGKGTKGRYTLNPGPRGTLRLTTQTMGHRIGTSWQVQFIFMENVANIISKPMQGTFGIIMAALAEAWIRHGPVTNP